MRSRVVLLLTLVVVIAGFAWYRWNTYRTQQRQVENLKQQLESLRRRAEGMSAGNAIRIKELHCAQPLESKGQSFRQAIEYCHELHADEWKKWAQSYPDLAKKKIQDRAIVEATK